jgi:hypothetical protein
LKSSQKKQKYTLKNGTVLEDNTLGQAKNYFRNGCFRIVGKRHRSQPRVLEHDGQAVVSTGRTLCTAWAYITYRPREVGLA